LKSALSRTILSLVLPVAFGVVGCTGEVNTPPMPNVKASVEKPDTKVPETGAGKAAYGASKKYQDLMPK